MLLVMYNTIKQLFYYERNLKMKLLTEEIIKRFKEYPLYSQDGKGMDSIVLVKYFNPVGAGTFLITEAEEQNGDWLLFGYCHIWCWEWGYVLLSDLENLKLPYGLTIERDLYIAESATVKDLL